MSQSPPPPPPAPHAALEFPVVHVWKNPDHYKIVYVVSQQWKWIMDRCKTDAMESLSEDSAESLPLQQLQQQQQQSNNQTTTATPKPTAAFTPRQRRARQTMRAKHTIPATLRIEVVDPHDGSVVVAWHGTSSAFDGLEDKDALVRTIQRCRVEELQLSPPSVLINWDVSLEECRNVVGATLPSIMDGSKNCNYHHRPS